jgi:hypothetical protein
MATHRFPDLDARDRITVVVDCNPHCLAEVEAALRAVIEQLGTEGRLHRAEILHGAEMHVDSRPVRQTESE